MQPDLHFTVVGSLAPTKSPLLLTAFWGCGAESELTSVGPEATRGLDEVEARDTLLRRAKSECSVLGPDHPRKEVASLIPSLSEVIFGRALQGGWQGSVKLPEQIGFPWNWFGSVTLDGESIAGKLVFVCVGWQASSLEVRTLSPLHGNVPRKTSGTLLPGGGGSITTPVSTFTCMLSRCYFTNPAHACPPAQGPAVPGL